MATRFVNVTVGGQPEMINLDQVVRIQRDPAGKAILTLVYPHGQEYTYFEERSTTKAIRYVPERVTIDNSYDTVVATISGLA